MVTIVSPNKILLKWGQQDLEEITQHFVNDATCNNQFGFWFGFRNGSANFYQQEVEGAGYTSSPCRSPLMEQGNDLCTCGGHEVVALRKYGEVLSQDLVAKAQSCCGSPVGGSSFAKSCALGLANIRWF